MSEQLYVCNRGGRLLGELQAEFTLAWYISRPAQARIVVSMRDLNTELVAKGNRILVKSDKLPSWTGYLWTPYSTAGGKLSLTAYSAEKRIAQRITGVNDQLSGTSGDIAADLIAIANTPAASGVSDSVIDSAGSSITRTYNFANIADVLEQLAADVGKEWWVGGALVNGQLTWTLNWAEKRGGTFSTPIYENGEAGCRISNVSVWDEGEIANEITAFGQTTDWAASAMYAVARNEESNLDLRPGAGYRGGAQYGRPNFAGGSGCCARGDQGQAAHHHHGPDRQRRRRAADRGYLLECDADRAGRLQRTLCNAPYRGGLFKYRRQLCGHAEGAIMARSQAETFLLANRQGIFTNQLRQLARDMAVIKPRAAQIPASGIVSGVKLALSTAGVSYPTNNTFQTMLFEIVGYDPDGAYDPLTGQYTAPEDMWVQVNVLLLNEIGTATQTRSVASITVNGSNVLKVFDSTTGSDGRYIGAGGSGVVFLNAGDTLSVSGWWSRTGTISNDSHMELVQISTTGI